ncbi:tetratricopeptide repeat protein [Streptomyces sparsus]
MARRERNHRLAALLAEAGWSAADLARTVNALGAAQSLALRYDRTAVAHWLTGSRPRPPVPDLVALAFSRRCNRLVTTADTGLTQTPQASHPSQPPKGGDAVHHLAALCREEIDPTRRVFLTRTVYSLADAGEPLMWKPAEPPPARIRSAGSATPADAQRLQEMIPLFAELTERHGGAHPRTALIAYLADETSRLLITRTASASLRRELFTGGAQLTHLLARMSEDAGYPGLAQRYYTTGLGLAREAGDSCLYAVTLRAMSLQALRLGHHQHARHLIDTAVDAVGRHAEPAASAFVLSQRALTHAYLHLRHAAVSDLVAAEKQHDRASTPAGPFTDYPRAGLDYQRAQTLLALDDLPGATRALSSALQARPDSERRARALTHAGLADTLLRTGQLEAACAHWHAFLDHYPHLRSVRVAQAFTQMRKALRPHQHQRHAATVLYHARRVRALPDP